MSLLSAIRWQVVADYLILALAFYVLLRWARSARAMRLALGVVGLHVLALLARNLDLVITSWVLDASAILAVLVLLLIFQPELRRAFMRLDSALRRWPRPLVVGSQASPAIANAAFELTASHLGALIVITRKDSIGELVDGGVVLGSAISSELLEAIFQKVSPLHDGAVIIEEGRLTRANAVLPLSRRQDLPTFYGTRHRAAVGLAERCDALVIAVSEERSEVTLMDAGQIRHMKDREQFTAILEGLLSPPRETFGLHLRRAFSANLSLKFAALALAAIVWSMSFLASGTTIRTVSAPVEFANVPSGTQVDEQSADALEIQLRGSPWIMGSVSPQSLVARFDLGRLHTGWHTLQFHPDSLDLPPGVVVDRVTPDTLRVEVVQTGGNATRKK
jgi:diadenylate cyclase